ncbi:MAG TPA: hypothetical protein VMB50_07410 [Myxococcales bacterium]|nr:hypothetical protein [Myxococcales bacterium]
MNDGNTPTSVTATLYVGGQTVPDGTQVTFGLTPSSAASFSPVVPGSPNTITTDLSTTSGAVTVEIYDLAVESVAIDLTSQVQFTSTTATVTGTTSIQFGGACPDSQVTAPVPTGSSGSGIAANIKFTCTDPVMGGSFTFQQNHPFENAAQVCSASVSDAKLQAVTNAAVQFLTEAGAIETGVQKAGQHPTMLTDSTGVAQVNLRVTIPYPEDVSYDPTMDGYFDQCAAGQTVGCGQFPRMWTDSNGHTYNPRDGWVTLIAATPGVLQPGAPSLPEPFVDSNDNNQYDPGEPYIDVNCNGHFDQAQTPDANGFIRIWSKTTVVWTDQLYPVPGAAPADPAAIQAGVYTGEVPSAEGPENPSNCSALLQPGETCNSLLRLVDINANLPSDLGTGNLMTLTPNGNGCDLTVNPSTLPMDLQYSEFQLARTDWGFSVTNSSTISGQSQTFQYNVADTATFNFVDTSVQENSNFPSEISTISYTGFQIMSGGCVGPAS